MTAPLILGFDTSAGHCAAALTQGDALLEATAEPMTKGQAERLMGFMESLLARHGFVFQDLSGLGIGTGPGNFTGIRIGVSAARGLALGLGIPAYGINGFDQRAHIHPSDALICVPAPRDTLYVRQASGAAQMPRTQAETLSKPILEEPHPTTLAASIATLAQARFPETAVAPAPYYLRAPDAAPAKDAPPTILT